jgi:Na+/H+-dicarboxylate symporter
MTARDRTYSLSVEFPRFLTVGSIIGVVGGFALGALAHAFPHPAFDGLGAVLGPLGAVWTNALKLIVVPLIVSFLVLATAGEGTKGTARIGGMTIALFVAFLIGAALLALVSTPPLLELMPDSWSNLGGSGAARMPGTASIEEGEPVDFGEWLVGLVPDNPVRAAAEGDIIGLVVVSVIFGLAIGRLSSRGKPLIELVVAIRDATLVVTTWLLWALPFAAFALTFGVAAAVGSGLAGTIGYWILINCVLLLVLTALLYPTTFLVGGVGIRRFARGVWPSQTVAAATRSSLATLPALMQGAEERLKLPADVFGLSLPLAVSTFKINLGLTPVLKLLFLAHLYGIPLEPGFILVFLAARILLSFSVPGIPSGGFMLALPLYLAAGIPVEALVLLKAVDGIPDIFKTLANVTADMSVAAIVARLGDRLGWDIAGADVMPEGPLVAAGDASTAG